MMDRQEFLVWLAVMLPLITSPGPANIATAGVAANFGWKRVLPFMAGLTLINITAVTLMGFGMDTLYQTHRPFFSLLEQLGAAYIVYLGYRMLRPKVSTASDTANALAQAPGFRAAVTFQVLNTKLYPVLMMMYSQFLDGSVETARRESIELGAFFVITVIINYFFWALLGALLGRMEGRGALVLQRYGFGSMLMIVGVWLGVKAWI